MALINLTETNYQKLLQRASRLHLEPDELLNDLLDDFLDETKVSSKKLGDLLANGFGTWEGIDESVDSLEYAQEIRRRSWQRTSV